MCAPRLFFFNLKRFMMEDLDLTVCNSLKLIVMHFMEKLIGFVSEELLLDLSQYHCGLQLP